MQLAYDLIKILGTLYITIVLLRLILQICQADFYNPICQFVVKATNPLLIPLRRVIPSIGRFDTASLVLALILQALLLAVLSGLPVAQLGQYAGQLAALTVLELLSSAVQLYTWAIILVVIISWVAPGSFHPGAQLLYQITEPLLAPIRRVLPSMGGLDLSPMILMLILFILSGALGGRYL